MKFIFTVALIFLGLFVKAQTVTSKTLILKIKNKAQNYLNSDPQYPSNKVASNWSDISEIHPRIDKKIVEKTNNPQINVKIDSLIAIDKSYPGYPNVTIIYSVIHAVQAKGSESWKIYSFQFDNNLNVLDVDKGSAELIIEKSKKAIQQADLAKKLITEVSDMKVADFKN